MRDYLTDSWVVSLFWRCARWLSARTAFLRKRAAAWAAARGPRALFAFFLAAIVANGLTLWLTGKPVSPWGAILRLCIFVVALAGFLQGGSWASLEEASLLIRWLRKRDGQR